MAKYLITYSYFENDFYRNNLNYFLNNAIISNPNYTYFIVVNGEIKDKIENKNVNVIQRENEGFDFGAWGYGLKQINVEDFDYFIFINCTCVGPFLPRYIPSSLNWIDLFVSKIDHSTKLCGPTINYVDTEKQYSPHIQSFAFSTDLIGLKLLLINNIFTPEKNVLKTNLIQNHEVKMSKLIIENNFKLYAFNLSENMNSKLLNNEIPHGDIHMINRYYEDTLNPIETMFIKSNRINNKILQNYLLFNSKND